MKKIIVLLMIIIFAIGAISCSILKLRPISNALESYYEMKGGELYKIRIVATNGSPDEDEIEMRFKKEPEVGVLVMHEGKDYKIVKVIGKVNERRDDR